MKPTPEEEELIEVLKDKLLVVFLDKLGGQLVMSHQDIDAISGALSFNVDDEGNFHFKILKETSP